MRQDFAFYKRERFLYLFAIISSILLSAWIDLRQLMINPDAICYLLSAQAVPSGISDVMHLCGQSKWPFYSVLIYGFVQISHFSYTSAAHMLDSLFSLLSVITFILIVRELGGSRRVLWLAALVILLSHDFNGVREYIIRDHGFWTFYLLSILMLIRYFHRPHWATAFAWTGSLILATLFRIEGAFFLFFMPFLSWFYFRVPLRKRCLYFFNLSFITILICSALVGWFLLHPQQSLNKLGRVHEVIDQVQHGKTLIVTTYQKIKTALAEHVLNNDSATHAGLISLIVLHTWYAIMLIGSLSLGYSLLLVYAWRRRIIFFNSAAALVLIGYIILNVAITYSFFLERLFLSKRYLIALSLIWMLWVPFALDDLMNKWASVRHRLFLLFAAVLIFISAMGGIFDFGYSKAYILDAGNWLAKNVPQKASLYANDFQLMYYSKHFGNDIFEADIINRHINSIENGKWKKFEYIAFRISRRNEAAITSILQEINLQPIQVFSNKRGDRILIYQQKTQDPL